MVKWPTSKIILILASVCILGSCNWEKKDDPPARILYINSYHRGYASSDQVMDGLHSILDSTEVVLETFYLDSKRKNKKKEIEDAISHVLDTIRSFKPDLLLVSDDSAVKFLIASHFKDSSIPVVFCGVNWSAVQYQLGRNVTGMLEVLPLKQTIAHIRSQFPTIRKLTVLSENSLSEQNNKMLLDTLFSTSNLDVTYKLVDTYEQWKDEFSIANKSSDLIYLPTNGAIINWDDKAARKYVAEKIAVPVITCDDFMMDYAVFGLTKVAREQGEWAAITALHILNGASPQQIPITRNKKINCWLNAELAKKVQFVIPNELDGRCTKI